MQNTTLNYSEILYLNAEKYVPVGSFLQYKEEMPNGKKLNVNKLGDLVSEAALAYLYYNGHIDLEIKTKKTLGIFSKQVVVSNKKSDGTGLTSLEKAIFDLSGGLEVSTILYKIIGDECSSPWSVIVEVVKKSLVSKEFLTVETITKKIIVSYNTYKYHLNPSKNIDFKDEIIEMDNKMKEFSNKDFYKLLVKSIDSGIASQKEKPDTSSD